MWRLPRAMCYSDSPRRQSTILIGRRMGAGSLRAPTMLRRASVSAGSRLPDLGSLIRAFQFGSLVLLLFAAVAGSSTPAAVADSSTPNEEKACAAPGVALSSVDRLI